uniref:Uncharacterized protein n=1 Tax=uncultured marine group II/III euryarchaeote AD1000_88_G11 TaxID=1457822 RepID=A0A075G072_9EURY|nr:hypothetical protein [uncultured marine group II/III euryarchaeote AD1000_88_G11]
MFYIFLSKMNRHNYEKYVVKSWFNREIIHTDENVVDNPNKWNMKRIGPTNFYKIGYVRYKLPNWSLDPEDKQKINKCLKLWNKKYIPFGDSPGNNEPKPYWFCRKGDWRPLWGELTKNHALVMKQLTSTYFAGKRGGSSESTIFPCFYNFQVDRDIFDICILLISIFIYWVAIARI